jgi:hypothetical protein
VELISVARRVLVVLALAVGVVAMHAVAGGHGTHAPVPPLATSHQASTHAGTPDHVTGPSAHQAEAVPVTEAAGVSPPCLDGCPSRGAGLAQVCLMVFAAAAFLLLAARAPGTALRSRPGARVPAARRAVSRPLRPPSLTALCISRT